MRWFSKSKNCLGCLSLFIYLAKTKPKKKVKKSNTNGVPWNNDVISLKCWWTHMTSRDCNDVKNSKDDLGKTTIIQNRVISKNVLRWIKTLYLMTYLRHQQWKCVWLCTIAHVYLLKALPIVPIQVQMIDINVERFMMKLPLELLVMVSFNNIIVLYLVCFWSQCVIPNMSKENQHHSSTFVAQKDYKLVKFW